MPAGRTGNAIRPHHGSSTGRYLVWKNESSTPQNRNAPSDLGNVHHGASESGALIRIQPNPLRNRGEVRLDLPISGHTKVELVDLAGRNILRLFEGDYDGGVHTISFDAGGLPDDAYICIVEVEGTRFHRLAMVNRGA